MQRRGPEQVMEGRALRGRGWLGGCYSDMITPPVSLGGVVVGRCGRNRRRRAGREDLKPSAALYIRIMDYPSDLSDPTRDIEAFTDHGNRTRLRAGTGRTSWKPEPKGLTRVFVSCRETEF